MSNTETNSNERFLAQQEDRLMDLKKILQDTLDTRDGTQSRPQSPSLGDARESDDDAQESAASEIDDILASRSAQRMLPVERALRKIKDGTYGFSDESGESIPRDRLEATPEALLTLAEETAADANDASFAGPHD